MLKKINIKKLFMSHVSLDYRMHEKDSASMQPKLKENLLMFIVDFVALAEQ